MEFQNEVNEASIFSDVRSLISYENYFTENYWRQQGGQIELGFYLPQWIHRIFRRKYFHNKT